MVKVSVKVRSGTASFRVGVTAQSVRRALRALRLVWGGHLRGVVKAAFLEEPEDFFVRRPSTSARLFGYEQIN